MILLNGQDSQPNLNVASLSQGLVGHWDMNGNAKDRTPYQNNGTVIGATLTIDRYGETSGAYNFNGVNNYITLPSVGPASWTEDFTISLWIYIPSTVTWNTAYISNILGRGSLTGSLGIVRYTTNNSVGFWLYSGNHQFVLATSINRNEWFYMTAVFKNGKAVLYNNSVYINESVAATHTGLPDNSVYNIGGALSFATAAGNYFQGSISDVRVYNRALSATEVLNLYKSY